MYFFGKKKNLLNIYLNTLLTDKLLLNYQLINLEGIFKRFSRRNDTIIQPFQRKWVINFWAPLIQKCPFAFKALIKIDDKYSSVSYVVNMCKACTYQRTCFSANEIIFPHNCLVELGVHADQLLSKDISSFIPPCVFSI